MDTRNIGWYAAPGSRAGALVGALAALVPSLLMWGFTVDDALISLRYAHQVVNGAGYAFNAGAAPTDGVTPLPWPFLLAPLAIGTDLLTALVRAKVLGVVVWTLAGARLGAALAREAAGVLDVAARIWPLLFVAAAFPIGAWAASGMETPLAIALCTLAACAFDRPERAGACAGLAAAFRPELAPWALALAAGATIARELRRRDDAASRPNRRRLFPVLLAAAPFAFCTLIRSVAFGQPVPLAVAAKPSDASHGVIYAVAALVVGLLPLLVLAPFALRRASPRAKTLVLALVVHALVMTAVGGDWMPYARLIVPILPGLALAATDLGAVAHRAATLGRGALAGVLAVYTILGAAPAGRHVQADRAALIAAARTNAALQGARVIAAVDIGWVGAATNQTGATVIDLAGLTDPAIAVLPGGHTSKRVDLAMLLDRKVDALVVYTPPRDVEKNLLRTPLFASRFEAAAKLPLGETEYVIFRSRTTPLDRPEPVPAAETEQDQAHP